MNRHSTIWGKLAVWILLVRCLSACSSAPSDDVLKSVPQQFEILLNPGPYSVSATSAELQGKRCQSPYEMHRPNGNIAAPLIVLAHGFQRTMSSVRGWAQHWASHGLPVAIPSLCSSSWLNGRHSENAEDLRALAALEGKGSVIYAGFSAGGLAALLAANDDPASLAYLGLDPVNSGGIGSRRIGQFQQPALVMLADPGACNARQNISPILERMANSVVRHIEDSTHCHYERPNDRLCEVVCGKVRPEAYAAQLRATIAIVATAWLLKQNDDTETSRALFQNTLELPALKVP